MQKFPRGVILFLTIEVTDARQVPLNGTLSMDERGRNSFSVHSAVRSVRPSINIAVHRLILGPLGFFRRFFMFFTKVKETLFSKFFLSLSTGKKTAYLGVFIALAVVVNVFSIDVTPSLKISFTYLVGFFSGTFFGPLIGFFILFFGDIVAFLLPSGGGVYWPLTGICTGLLALLPGFLMNNLRLSFRHGVYVKILLSMLLSYLLVTCSLGAYSNYLYVKYVIYAGREYATAFGVYLAGKILFSTVVSALNYILVFVLVPALNACRPLKLKIE